MAFKDQNTENINILSLAQAGLKHESIGGPCSLFVAKLH